MCTDSLQLNGKNCKAFPRAVTPRDVQALRAARIAQARTREAVAAIEGNAYRVLFHDPAAGVMVLRRRENPATAEGYAVNYRALTCSCPDMTGTLAAENRRCAAHGLCPSLLCKHILHAWDLAHLGRATEPDPALGAYADFMEAAPVIGGRQLIWGGAA